MRRSKAPFAVVAVLILTSCTQEIRSDSALPVVTSVMATETPPLTTPISATPTPVFSPAEALASGPINIITIGDDLTRGDGDDLGRGYPGRLLELVSQIRPGSTVINFGQTGWTSNDLIHGDGDFSGQLERAVGEAQSAASQRRASVVLVWIGGNDLWELYSGEEPVTLSDETSNAERFAGNMDTILFGLRDAGAEVIVAKLDDQSKRPARTRSDTYPSITAVELQNMSRQVNRYNEIIAGKAGEYNALTVDFYGMKLFTENATLSGDGMHPNPAGYELIAQAWYKALIPILP
jgi:lysophospholipase L1-like esterase